MSAAGDEKETSSRLSLGQRVVVINYTGTVRFIGKTHFASGLWIGIELDAAIGKNNGTAMGVKYFECQAQHGLFVREDNVKTDVAQLPTSVKSKSVVDDDDDEPIVRKASTLRRYGISSETFSRHHQLAQELTQPKTIPKSAEERNELCTMIRNSADAKVSVMFGNLSEETFNKVVDAMFLKAYAKGEKVCEVGDSGDHLFIVKSGSFDLLQGIDRRIFMETPRAMSDSGDLTPRGSRRKVQMHKGDIFGDEGLLSCAPRSFTVEATDPSELWCLQRTVFRMLIVGESEDQFGESLAFLKGCQLFSGLNDDQLAILAEVLHEEDFMADEAIVDQGDHDDLFFILRRGSAVACIMGDMGEVEVKHYTKGDFFGEVALLEGGPRQASVYAVGPSTCLYVSSSTFIRVLGPLTEVLQKNMETYTKYQEAILSAENFTTRRLSLELRQGSQAVEDVEETDLFEGATKGRHRTSTRMRDRTLRAAQDGAAETMEQGTSLEMPLASPHVSKSELVPHDQPPAPASEQQPPEQPAATEPGSLQEKIAMDFQVPELVTPCDQFIIQEASFNMFGGLQLGQKFTMDKPVVARTSFPVSRDGLEDTYSWSAPSCHAGSTHVTVLCQKGQKSASDPTPNQDNYFVLGMPGGVQIYGVFDGHGPFGHLVSLRLAQSVPSILCANQHYGKDWEQALKEAFLAAQQELLAFAAKHNINLEASGAAGSVLVKDGPDIHISHIGDAGVMLASWNRHDSRVVGSTEDHKPQLPAEQERLEAAGSEVREVDGGSFRIYRRGTNFPGLTMSRAFGDTACGGVVQEPEHQEHHLQPNDELYAIVASDGIWEFLDYQKTMDLTNKKLRLKGPREMSKFLVEASRKRWNLCCGDYCDDITALIVQWNVKKKDTTSNYVLTVTRPE